MMNIVLCGRINLSNYKFNRLNNVDERLKQTKDSISALVDLGVFKNIIISDSSGTEILSNQEIIDLESQFNGKIEQIVFSSEDVFDHSGGIKGSSELVNLQLTLKNAKTIFPEDSFYKLTPRYKIDNFKEILHASLPYKNFYFDWHVPLISKYKRIIATSLFKETVQNIIDIDVPAALEFLNEANGVYIEHLFYHLLETKKRKYIPCPFPVINAVIGSLGLNNGTRYYTQRNMLSKAGLMAFSAY
jgi:hypothetical protein